METKEVTLEYILESNDLLLIDTSAYEGCFLKSNYNVNSLEQIDLKLLEYENEKALDYIRLITNPKFFTIQEVIDEFKVYLDRLGDKVNWINRKGNKNLKIRIDKMSPRIDRKFYNRKKRNKDNFNSASLEEYHENIYNIYNIQKQKKIKINDIRYELLTEMFKIIDKAIYLKKDTSYVYGRDLREDNNHTDEKLCSALIWKSLFSDNRTGILTRDTDFIRLLRVVPKIIGSLEFLSRNKYFIDKINSNTPYLYFIEENGYQEMKLNYEFQDIIKINCINGFDEKDVKDKIRVIWKQFMNQ